MLDAIVGFREFAGFVIREVDRTKSRQTRKPRTSAGTRRIEGLLFPPLRLFQRIDLVR
jgi:hypothetical protein